MGTNFKGWGSTWLLYLEELADIVKQHFQIVCYKDFLQNPVLHNPKYRLC